MKKFTSLVALAALLVSGNALSQSAQKLSATRLDLSPASYASMPPPAGCIAGNVAVFLGSPVRLNCDSGLTYDAATDTLTVSGKVISPRYELDAASNFGVVFSTSSTSHGALRDMLWTNNLANGTPDVGLARSSAGVLKVTDGSTGAGKILVADGTAGAVGLGFASESSTGFYHNSGTLISVSASSTNIATFAPASLGLLSTAQFGWSSSTPATVANDLILTRGAAATLQLGAANSATHAAVAQTLQVQSNITEADQAAPASFTIIGPRGTGTGAAGSIVFQTGVPQTTGSTAHVPATALTLTNAGTGGTSAPQVIFLDGTSYTTGTGNNNIWYSGGNSSYGTAHGRGVNGFAIGKDGSFAATSNQASITPDAWITRGAAATWQLGAANSATPVAQTLRAQGSRGGTDTNVSGANLTIKSGAGTGNATPSQIRFETPYPTTSGSTQQSSSANLVVYTDHVETSTLYAVDDDGRDLGTMGTARRWRNFYLSRATLGSKTKTLTESSATGFVDIDVTAGQRISGEVIYEVYAADATDFQTVTGTLRYAAVNKAGTITVSVSEVGTQATAVSAGTLTATNTAADTTNKITLSCNATSSLTQTTLEIRYRLNSVSTNTITPL